MSSMTIGEVPSDPLGVGFCGSVSSGAVEFRDTLLSVDLCGDR